MHHPAAQIEHRPFCRVDHRRGTGQRFRADRRHRFGRTGRGPLGKLDGFQHHILGNIDNHRAGPPRSRDGEGARDDAQQIGRRLHEKVVLGDRHGHTVGIDFLKGVGTDQRSGHLPGDRHQRNRIKAGIGNGGQQVHHTGAGSGRADGNFTADPRRALRHEPGSLFVPGKDMGNLLRL